MTAGAVRIRRLMPEDAQQYREIRLEALRGSPDAFSSTFENEHAQPLDWFAQRLSDSTVLAAFSGELILGIAGFYLESGVKQAHKGVLWGMYVRPSGRGTGVGRRLVEEVIAHARPRAELIQLRVISDNEAARRLYRSLGFVEYGVEWHAAKYRGRYHDDVLMVLPLVIGSGADAMRAATEATPA